MKKEDFGEQQPEKRFLTRVHVPSKLSAERLLNNLSGVNCIVCYLNSLDNNRQYRDHGIRGCSSYRTKCLCCCCPVHSSVRDCPYVIGFVRRNRVFFGCAMPLHEIYVHTLPGVGAACTNPASNITTEAVINYSGAVCILYNKLPTTPKNLVRYRRTMDKVVFKNGKKDHFIAGSKLVGSPACHKNKVGKSATYLQNI